MTESPHVTQLSKRMHALAQTPMDDDVRIEPGEKCDYRALARFHYKGRTPGVVTAVYRAVHEAPTVVGRYCGRTGDRRVVGVLLRSLPRLGCTLRDHATHGRYRGLGWRAAAHLINHEVRTISRVVIDPQWRGVGLAVRLVRHALAHPETDLTEALAAMGRVHPFFERAGMVRYERPPRPEHARLMDALQHVSLPPFMLASTVRCAEHIASLPASTQDWLELEFRHWHRAAFRTTRRAEAAMSFDMLVRIAGNELFVHPVYYLSHHADPADTTSS